MQKSNYSAGNVSTTKTEPELPVMKDNRGSDKYAKLYPKKDNKHNPVMLNGYSRQKKIGK